MMFVKRRRRTKKVEAKESSGVGWPVESFEFKIDELKSDHEFILPNNVKHRMYAKHDAKHQSRTSRTHPSPHARSFLSLLSSFSINLA